MKVEVLAAVINGATTLSDVMTATGRSRSTVYYHLSELRDEGLVDWEDGKNGTLHPLVEVVRVFA